MTKEKKHLIRILKLQITEDVELLNTMKKCWDLAQHKYKNKLLLIQNIESGLL